MMQRLVSQQMMIPTINKENYYSNEIDQVYMSNSQYKSFLECEAATMAKLHGEWQPPSSEALLFGQYVHAWLEGEQAFDEFKLNTPALFTQKKGQLYKQYQLADLMIEAIQNDDLCMFVLQGDKEVIITGKLFGVPWTGKKNSMCTTQQVGALLILKRLALLEKKNMGSRAWLLFICRSLWIYCSNGPLCGNRKTGSRT
ncbi:hypothetical protein BsIDN1_46100 [Bacillus safensis]|uniref:Putative exodeoxyribonuclease 8 PDDEXK-like domain-containing protein n=1 Tax=Bacillus safensis TaxID=561879 RepID=A0A5S9MEF5_BACIA|nr:hypothetical protein BsIDN1_46100 [Bacillus safensis]